MVGAQETVQAARIEAMAISFGVGLESTTLDQLTAFGTLFLGWNARINLSGRTTPDILVDRHFADAMAGSRFIGDGERVIDVGSGGGLPVIPLAVLKPTAHFDLYEPIAKKVAFLRTAVRELRLGDRLRIHAVRVQSPVGDLSGRFDVAMSRATYAPNDWLTLGRELIRDGGRVLVFATAQTTLGAPPFERLIYAPNRELLLFGRGST